MEGLRRMEGLVIEVAHVPEAFEGWVIYPLVSQRR